MRRRRRTARGRYSAGNRYQQRNRNKLTFAPVIVMLCLSVGCGYAAAKYVVDPVVNYVPQLKAEKSQQEATGQENDQTEKADIIEDEADVIEKGNISGYALQFGCYSGKAAAESTKTSIDVENLQVIEQDDLYKIIGEIYKTKEEAKKALDELPDSTNAFVTPIYE